MDNVLIFYDNQLKKGKLNGTGETKVTRNRQIKTYRKALVRAVNYVPAKKRGRACAELKKAAKWLDRDGKISPQELVTGEAAPKLLNRIKAAISRYKCS